MRDLGSSRISLIGSLKKNLRTNKIPGSSQYNNLHQKSQIKSEVRHCHPMGIMRCIT